MTSKEGLQLVNYSPKRYAKVSLAAGHLLTDSVHVDRVAERWLRDLEGDDDYQAYVEQPED